MKIEDVNRGISKHKRRRRIGRGIGSGFGKTCGRGHKGQKSRAGFSSSPVWQGGAMPLVRRVPKRGFNNKFALQVAVLNVGDLEKHFETGDEVSPDSIKSKLLSGNYDVLKILGDGELTKKLTVSAHRFSKTAQQKIEAAGGQVQVIPGRTPVREKAAEKKKQDK